jgi:hypothetical protein
MATYLSESSKQELKSFSPEDQEKVSGVISLLEDTKYREQNKVDLALIEEGYKIWSLVVGRVWLAFHEDNYPDMYVVWMSLRSRFRP